MTDVGAGSGLVAETWTELVGRQPRDSKHELQVLMKCLTGDISERASLCFVIDLLQV